MVARRQGVILDGFGAYEADGRRGVFVFAFAGGGGGGGVGGGGEGLGGLLGRPFQCHVVGSRRGFVIAVASGGSIGVRSVAVPTAPPRAVAPPATVSSGLVSGFGGRRGRHAEGRGRRR